MFFSKDYSSQHLMQRLLLDCQRTWLLFCILLIIQITNYKPHITVVDLNDIFTHPLLKDLKQTIKRQPSKHFDFLP